MKFVLLLCLAVIVPITGMAAPVKEIVFLSSPYFPGDDSDVKAIALFNKDFPDVKVKHAIVDLTDGSTITMDAMLAAGLGPNIYLDTLVRSSKYLTPNFALDLKPLVRDLGKYVSGVLDPYTVNGAVLGLPFTGSAQGMAVNLDIMDEIGYKVPPKWTIDDFLAMAKLVKEKYKGKKWATGMFAANQSGDYLINNWFASFGVKYYDKGKAAVAATGGARTYSFFQTLVKEGYVPDGCATLTDDDYVLQWAYGELAATAFFPLWMEGYWKTAMEQGKLAKPFRVAFFPFPRVPEVANVPTYSLCPAIVVRKTGTEADVWAARLVEYLNSPYAQDVFARQGNVPTRVDVAPPPGAHAAQVAKIAKDGGMFDVGLTSPFFSATRPVHYPILQRVLTLKVTPEAAIAEYAKALDRARSR